MSPADSGLASAHAAVSREHDAADETHTRTSQKCYGMRHVFANRRISSSDNAHARFSWRGGSLPCSPSASTGGTRLALLRCLTMHGWRRRPAIVDSATGQKSHINPFGDENAQWRGTSVKVRCRNLPQSTLQSTTTSITAIFLNKPGPPPWPNGVNSQPEGLRLQVLQVRSG